MPPSEPVVSTERRVTLKDMAERLGVSISAVSKALRDDPRISARQKKRVRDLAVALDYHPDPRLTALAAYRFKSRTRTAPVSIVYLALVPFGPNWVSAFYYGVERQAKVLGYQISYYYLSPEISRRRHCDILHARGVCGIVLAPLSKGMTELDFDWTGFSVVALGERLVQPAFHRVLTDCVESLMLALENARFQHNPLGIAITQEQDQHSIWNWTSAIAVAKCRTQDWPERLEFYRGSEKRPAQFLAWLKEKKPAVLISLTHPIHDWLVGAGYRFPQDLGLVSLDFHAHAPLCVPGIDQNFDAVGVAGMTLLHSSLLQGETGVPPSRLALHVQPHWVAAPDQ